MFGFVAGGAALVACSSGAPEHSQSSEDDLVVCSPGLMKTPRPAMWSGERVISATSVVIPLRRNDIHVEMAIVDASKGSISQRVIVATSEVAHFLALNGSERCTQHAPVPPPPAPWCPPDAHGREVCPESCVDVQVVNYARSTYCANDALRFGMH